MTRKRGNSSAPKAAQASRSATRWSAEDSFANFAARVGVGTDNQSSTSSYQFDFISRNRIKLEAMYRSSWIVGQAVDVVAEDMVRAGIDIQGDAVQPDDKETIYGALQRLRIWDMLCDTIKWSRLYGGSIAVMLIDGQNMSTPLRTETIVEDQFKGLFVMDRWLINPSLNQLVQDYGPDFGKPMFYDVIADGMAIKRQRIHYSRVIRLDGVDLPYWQRYTEQGWGQSVIERLYDRLVAFDSTTMGVAQLVYKAHLRTMSVKDLRSILAQGGPAEDALLKNVDFIRRFQSNEGLTLIDAQDKIEYSSFAFAGLDNVLMQFGQQLSGALQIPLVRLFGQSPAGLNATGESDLAMYHDHIKQEQERRLRSPFATLFDVLWRSELGSEPPEGFSFEFRSLEQMSDAEKADVAYKVAQAVDLANQMQALDRAGSMKELRQSSHATGIFSNITDEQIAEAENDPPPVLPGMEDLDANGNPIPAATPGQPGASADPAGGDDVRGAASKDS